MGSAKQEAVVDAVGSKRPGPSASIGKAAEEASAKRQRRAATVAAAARSAIAPTSPRTLVVLGMGNSGGTAKRERHSLGARVVESLIMSRGAEAKAVDESIVSVVGARRLPCGKDRQDDALLLLPQGPINDSGQQLKVAMDAFGVPSAPFLAIVDDCWLPLGSLRFKAQGSSGGHKGLSNIESSSGRGQSYHRLKLGIGGKNLKDFVTGSFTDDEEIKLEPVIRAAVRAVEAWLLFGPEAVQRVMGLVNAPGFVSQSSHVRATSEEGADKCLPSRKE